MTRPTVLRLWRLDRNPPGRAHIEGDRDEHGITTLCNLWLAFTEPLLTATATTDRIRHGAVVCKTCLRRLPVPATETSPEGGSR